MRKAILAAILVGVGIMFTGQGAVEPEKRIVKSDSAAGAELTTKTQQKQQSTTNNVLLVEQADSPKTEPPKKQVSDDVEIQRKLVKFTGYLVLVGIFQGVILAFTIWAIKHQSDTTKNSERAWVMVDLDWTQRRGISQGSETTSLEVRLICRNDGNTPAWITEKRVLFRIVESLPITPQLEPINMPGDFLELRPEPLGVRGDSEIDVELVSTGHRRDIGKASFIYGVVKYRDAFKVSRETRFGYMLNFRDSLERIAAIGDRDYYQYNSYT